MSDRTTVAVGGAGAREYPVLTVDRPARELVADEEAMAIGEMAAEAMRRRGGAGAVFGLVRVVERDGQRVPEFVAGGGGE